MIHFNREDFVDNYLRGLNPTTDQEILLQELDGKGVLLPESYVRENLEYNVVNGGVNNPHICDPDTREFRMKIHDCCYLYRNLILTLNKFRSVTDDRPSQVVWS
jgi:hypothetical protein